MVRLQLGIVGIVALSIPGLSAKGTWEKKDYHEWDQEEVRQVLLNSPWARQVTIRVGRAPSLNQARGRDPGRSMGEIMDGAAPNPGGAPSEPGCEHPQLVLDGNLLLHLVCRGSSSAVAGKVIIRWRSALPIKQALVKLRFGDQAASNPDGKEFLKPDDRYYVLAITGLPSRMARIPEDANQLRHVISLQRRRKLDMEPEAVFVRSREEVVNVYALFPRSEAITLEDKNVHLVMSVGELAIRRRFKLKDMVFDGRLEL